MMNFKLFTILLALPILSSCVSVLPEPEVPTGLYRLGDIPAIADLQTDLIVREPEGGRVFGGRAIATEGEDGALRLVRGVEWAEPASRMLQIGLLDAFSANGAGLAVEKGAGARGDLELAWRMSDFTLSGTDARCELELTLLNGKTREALLQRRVETHATAVSEKTPDRASAMVEAARACVREAAEVIASAGTQY